MSSSLRTFPPVMRASIASFSCSIPSSFNNDVLIICAVFRYSFTSTSDTQGARSVLFKTAMQGFPSAAFIKEMSSSDRGRLLSRSSRTRSALLKASLLRSTPIASTTSDVSRMPAVSVSRRGMPRREICSSIVSRVVPGMSVTMLRCSPRKRFISEDLPTLGLPTMATERPSRRIFPSSAFSSRAEMPDRMASKLSSIFP